MAASPAIGAAVRAVARQLRFRGKARSSASLQLTRDAISVVLRAMRFFLGSGGGRLYTD